MSVEKITESIGIMPRVQKDRSVRKEAYWVSQSRSGEDSELLTVLKEHLDELEPHAAFLDEFRRTGGRIEIFVG
jgi:hypothetical protein